VSGEHPRGFGSDNHAGAHPEVLEAIAAANHGHAPAYGADPWTARLDALFRRHFGDSARVFPVFNGSGANVACLDAVTRTYESVICAATAHMNVDECGAPERIAGTKLLAVPTPDGKLTPGDVGRWEDKRGDEHFPPPRVVSITEATELGTVYSPAEIATIADATHERGMMLHLDGARLANAAASLDVSLREITADVGVDLLSFGGTKNGLLLGDAVVFLRPELADRFEYVRKQLGQLASKMRFISVQFEALLGGDLWLRNARHANTMARRLRDAVEGIDGVRVSQAVEANAVFATVPPAAIPRLRDALPAELPFHVWDPERSEIRLMASWDTAEEDVDRLAAALGSAVDDSQPGR
jgi:threonine aldolase